MEKIYEAVENLPLLVANYYGISINYLLSKCRKRAVVLPRHVLIYLLTREFTIMDREVCKIINRKARSTVYNAVVNIEHLQKYDKDLQTDLSS